MDNKEEILAGNILIAEFDNWVKTKVSGINGWLRYGLIHIDTQFNYHKSWDSLMPVIDKIERLECVDYTKQYNEHEQVYDFEINLKEDGDTSSFIVSSDNKIESAYCCVVKFIEWYNNRNK